MAWRSTLGRTLKELRVMCCPKGDASVGARDFFQRQYPELKMLNPSLPILIRSAEGTEARVLAQYGRGVERVVSVQGLSAAEVEAQVKDLAVGSLASEALLHEEWRTLLDTSTSFGLFMQLHGGPGLWEKVKRQDFLEIYSPAANQAGVTTEQRGLMDEWKALSSEGRDEYSSNGLRAFCASAAGKVGGDAPRSDLIAQWRALPAAEKAAFEEQYADSEGMRYYKVAIVDELKSRRRVAGEPDDAEEQFLFSKWMALPATERATLSQKALSGAQMREYPEYPPFWKQ